LLLDVAALILSPSISSTTISSSSLITISAVVILSTAATSGIVGAFEGSCASRVALEQAYEVTSVVANVGASVLEGSVWKKWKNVKMKERKEGRKKERWNE
jgi:hypothetical protein